MKDHVDLINRIAETLFTAILILAGVYFGGHVFAAILHGAFQAVTR